MTAPADAGLRDAARRNRRLGLTAGVVVALVAVVLLSLNTKGPLTPLKAIILGGVEGFTEYLPVSSTGHLLVVQRLLDLGDGDGKLAADTYAIAIQIGAILAVVVLYWRRLGQLASGAVGRDTRGGAEKAGRARLHVPVPSLHQPPQRRLVSGPTFDHLHEHRRPPDCVRRASPVAQQAAEDLARR